MTIEQARESFTHSHFSNYIGIEVERFVEGEVKLKIKTKKDLLNSEGTLHGGIHATLLDTALGLTIRSITKIPVTTITLNLNYLNVPTSDELIATGRVLRLGYKNATSEGEIYDSNGVLIAKAVGTFKLLRKDKVQ